jgi:site-specific recombinase XerD
VTKGTTVYNLTGEDLNAFYAYLSDCGLSGSTAQKYHSLIHAAYKFAVKREYIDCNPCDFAERPKAEKYHANYYDKDELNRLILCSHGEPIYIPILLAVFYGLRRQDWCRIYAQLTVFYGDRIPE